jgi:integral membrane protein
MAVFFRAPPYCSAVGTQPSTSRLSGVLAAFRTTAFVEAATYLALLAAVFVYRVLDGPDYIGVLGPIHGIAFLVYLFLVLRIREGQGWRLGRTIVVVLAAAVPFGGFWAGRHLRPESSS